MSRILTLIAAASLLSLAACQSAPKAPEAAAEQASAQTAAAEAPAAQTPMAPEAAAPAAEQAPAAPMAPAEPVKPAPEPVKAAPAKVEPKAMPKAHVAAKPATISKDQALALARKGNCLTCHSIEKRVVGPAWKDVAAKYRGKADGVATITAHIKKGGSFGWKFGSMPPRGGSQLSDADVAKLAGFIAGLK